MNRTKEEKQKELEGELKKLEGEAVCLMWSQPDLANLRAEWWPFPYGKFIGPLRCAGNGQYRVGTTTGFRVCFAIENVSLVSGNNITVKP